MKNSGYTPGPWMAVIVGSCNDLTYKIRRSKLTSHDTASYNSHLISAAPEMLAALEAALDTIGIDSVGPMSNHLLTVRKQVLTAIKKAKGE